MRAFRSNYFHIFRKYLSLACLALVSACANLNLYLDRGETPPAGGTFDQLSIPPEANQHLNNIAFINDFKISGRIGIQAQGYGLSGPIEWQHSPQHDDIGLFSPFGSKIAQINKTEDGVILTNQDGKTYKAQDAESLTQSTLGWRIPFASLTDWLLGRPTKGVASQIKWDETGKLNHLMQDGWEINYMEYQTQNNHTLPTKINLRSTKVNVRLVIENWDIAQTVAAQKSP